MAGGRNGAAPVDLWNFMDFDWRRRLPHTRYARRGMRASPSGGSRDRACRSSMRANANFGHWESEFTRSSKPEAAALNTPCFARAHEACAESLDGTFDDADLDRIQVGNELIGLFRGS